MRVIADGSDGIGLRQMLIEQCAADMQAWGTKTNVILGLWAAFAVAISAWTIFHGTTGAGDFAARGSPMGIFFLAFRWFRSNYVKNERMRNLLSSLPILIEDDPTETLRADLKIAITRAIVGLNSGAMNNGIEALRKFRGKET